MMPSMRDKIAERLMQHYAEGGPWDGYMEADIVLDALLEPTEGMVAAGADRDAALEWQASGEAVPHVWAAMILAAKEGK